MDVRIPKGRQSHASGGSSGVAKILRGRKRLWIDEDDVNDDPQSDEQLRPRKLQRQPSVNGPTFARAFSKTVNEHETLSTRLQYAVKMWRLVGKFKAEEASTFVSEEPLLMSRMLDALLYTPYFPLQQFYCMTLCGMATLLNCAKQPSSREAVNNLAGIVKEKFPEVLPILPLSGIIDWKSPRISRRIVNKINQCSRACESYRILKCWVSSSDKESLKPIQIENWIDFGATTASFYRKQATETIVVNIPYSCIQATEADDENCLVSVVAKHLIGFRGISMLAFMLSDSDFIPVKNFFQQKWSIENKKNTYIRIKNCGRDQATSEDSRDSGYVASNGDTRRISGQPVYSPAKVSDEEDSVDDNPTITTPDKAMQDQTGTGIEYDTDTAEEQWTTNSFESSGGKVCSSTVSDVSNVSEGWISSNHEPAKTGCFGQEKIKALQQLRLLQVPTFEQAAKGEEMTWGHSNSSDQECLEPTQDVVEIQPTFCRILGVTIIGIAVLHLSPWLLLLILHTLNDIFWLITDLGNQYD